MNGIAARLRARRPRAGRATAAEETVEEEDSRPIDISDLTDFEDVKPVESLPSRPFAFMAFLIRHHFLKNTLFIVATVVLATATDSINPYVLGQIVNGIKNVAGSGLSAWPHDLTFLLIVIGLLWSGGQILYRIWEYIDLHTTPKMRALSQRYMFGYLLGHSHRFFQDNFAGKIGQRVKQGSQATMALMQVMCFDLVRLITLMLVACTLLFRARPDYAFILLGWTALYLSVSYFLARRCVKLSSHLSDEMSTVTGRLIDAVTNADLIRAFAKSVFEKNFLVRYLKREMNASQRLRWFLILMRQWMSLATIALIMTLIVISARGVIAGHITIGDFTMIYMLSNMVAMNVQNLSYQMLNFFQQFGTLADALSLLTHEHEIPDAPNAKPLQIDRGGIKLENVTFHHQDGSTLFDNLNIDIKPGEKIGLVGHSGAGKSTLVKLIRRQYAPLAGRILVDGQDVALVTSDSLNDAIAEVPQSAGIFHRSIRENIRYHNPTASEEDVIHAAKLAHAHEFIVARPTGYGTVVGEQGIKLSGGERQRIAIARAFLKNAKILILDEATSSLDSESEHLIQSALFKLMEGRTVIAIAHRLSTIVGMDRILYMENGRILEEGSHDELVARRGAYARLWERQVSGFEAA